MIIAITNQKGGVGKTTTAVHLAAGLKQKGYKVLLIDTDAQCNATDTYRAHVDGYCTLYDLLCAGEDAKSCIQHSLSGDIIASDPLIAEAERKIPDDSSRFFLLKEKLEPILDNYDFVVIDTPPALGVILQNVLTVSDEIIIPLSCDRYALQGLDQLISTINSAKKYVNPRLNIKGLLLIKYAKNQKLSKEISDKLVPLSEELGTVVFDTKIRETAACRMAQSHRMTLFEYEKGSNTSIDYMKLIDEYLGG